MAPGESASARLVEEHLDLAHRVAAIVHRRVKDHVELDELFSLAAAGLAEAALRYEPAQGVAFRTFAWYRVHGAVIDGLRKATHLPRRVWRTLVALRAASEYLENQGDKAQGARAQGAAAPTTAQALGQIKDALHAIRTMYVTSIADVAEVDQPHDPTMPADEGIDHQRLTARMVRALGALPERERALVTKHYYEGKNLLEAGAELGISKSWASRLHAQAVDRLRAALDDDGS